jgi:hypothetical protein
MSSSAIESANDDSINVIAVHIVRLDLEPCIAAVVHLPCRVQCFNDDSLFLWSSRRRNFSMSTYSVARVRQA